MSIPDSVTTIGDRAFGFHRLNSLTLGNKVRSIGFQAFINNTLAAVRIPASIESIGENAFQRWGSQPAIFTFLGGAPTLGLTALGDPATTSVWCLAPFASEFPLPWNGYYTTQAEHFPTSSTPTIVGTPKVGLTLTVHAGTWSPTPTLSYAWRQVGSATVLGTLATYEPVASDLTHALTVTVTATSADYAQGLTSTATAEVGSGTFTATPTPTISGTAQVGKTLTANNDSWEQDVALSYTWKRVDSAIVTTAVGSGSTYVVSGAEKGKKLFVTVTASLGGYTTVSRSSLPTTAVTAGVFTLAPIPTIAGTVRNGETVTAIAGTWTSGAVFSYVWKRSGVVIPLASAERYTIVVADIGKALTVTVTATRSGFTTLSKTSVATAAVTAIPFTIDSVPTITVTGTVSTGFTLNASTGEWSPSSGVTYSYVWSRASSLTGTKTVITGATTNTHKLVSADSGKYLTVSVTATKLGYITTASTSVATKIAG